MLKIRLPCSTFWSAPRLLSSRRDQLQGKPRQSSSAANSDREEKYIQTTTVPTFHFQPGLPRLSIPKLDKTCERYLAALKPIVSEEQFRETESIVKEFGKSGGKGEALNNRLIAKDKQNKHTSYITGPWFDMYLESRDPLVLNFNPFMGFKDDFRGINDQALRAANFIRSVVRFRAALWEEKLEPEVFHLNPAKSDTDFFKSVIRRVPSMLSWYAAAVIWKAFPLDMSQYGRLLNSTRIPETGKDRLMSFKDESPRHLVVMRNGNFYSLDVIQENGLAVPSETVYEQLQGILLDETPPPSHPLGYLTGINRDKWAEARKELVSSEMNRDTLKCIDSSLFMLCLDDHELHDATDLSHAMLHNHGANRWFDKSFSLIVSKGGHSAVNFEHAWGDGVAVLRLFNEIYKDSKTGIDTGTGHSTLDGVTRLQFDLSPSLKSAVEAAKKEVEDNTNKLSIDTMQYMKYGRNLLKKMKLSPDAILQMAIQIAYYRQYKCSVSTYESCSTAAFKHGRTETIRSASVATKACCESFEPSNSAGPEEMMAKIKEAADWHTKLVKEAAMGQGFDRHMFALRNLAADEKLPIFEDPSYSSMNHVILSTSTLSSEAVLLGGFAPVTPDGYGIGYGVMDDWLGTQVSTYDTRDGAAFVKTLENVFDDFYEVLHGRNFK